MTHDKELITIGRALRKAFDNGWSYTPETAIEKLYGVMLRERVYLTADFTKAIWGEQRQMPDEEVKKNRARGLFAGKTLHHGWQHHLQRMVIAEDPIAYLFKNLYP